MANVTSDDTRVVLEAPIVEIRGSDGTLAGRIANGVGSGAFAGPSAPTGSSDDSTLVSSLLPDARLAAGTFKAPSGLAVASQGIIEGRGMGSMDTGVANPTWQDGLSTVQVSSQTADGVLLSSRASAVKQLSVVNTAGVTPSAGAGIHLNANGFRARDVSSKGFYNGIHVDTANGYVLDSPLVADPVNFGIRVTGGDIGDGVIQNATLLSGPVNSGVTAFKWEGGGGMKVTGLKANLAKTTTPWTNGIDIHCPNSVVTSELLFDNSVLDSYTGTGVNVAVDSGGGLSRIMFDDVLVRGSSNPTNGYVLRGNGLTDIGILGGACILGTNGLSCVDVNNVQRFTLDGTELGGVPVTIPIILLGSSVTQAKISPGVLRGPNASGAWTTGTNQYILENLSNGTTTGQGSSSEFQFSFQGPAITSNSVYSTLWKMVGFGYSVEFTLWALGVVGITSGHVLVRQERLVVTSAGVAAFTTVGTDAASSTDIDIQWLNLGGSAMSIGAKINAGSTASSLGANLMSQVRVIGGLQQLYGYA